MPWGHATWLFSLPFARATGTCHLSQSTCGFDELPQDESTLIIPGGDTRCIFSGSQAYGFQVVPGVRDKAILFFQGGGACFNDASTRTAKPCLSDLVLQPLEGIFSRTSSNPFGDRTVVHVNYCSGDLHVGNVVRWYLDPEGQRVEQRGYSNALSAVRWARAQLAELSSLIVAGSSTGALGALMWSQRIFRSFPSASGAVVLDSDLAIFPQGTEGPLLQGFGACATELFPAPLRRTCEQMALQDVLRSTLRSFENLPLAAISSSQDRMQLRFYNAVCMAEMLPELTSSEFESKLLQRVESYNQHPNFVAFILPGQASYFLPREAFYTNGISDWLSQLPETPGQHISSVCSGCAKSFTLLAEPMKHRQGLPADAAPVGTGTLITVPEVSQEPWWSALYHAGLVATAVLLCAGAVVERRNGPLPGMGYVSSRMSDEDEEDEEEKG